MSVQLMCLIVVVAVAVHRVLDLIRKQKMTDKIVSREPENEREVRAETKCDSVLQSLDAAREQVGKALEKAKAASEQGEAASEKANTNRGAV